MNETQALVEAMQALQATVAELRQSVDKLQATLEYNARDPVDLLRETVSAAQSQHPALVTERRARERSATAN